MKLPLMHLDNSENPLFGLCRCKKFQNFRKKETQMLMQNDKNITQYL